MPPINPFSAFDTHASDPTPSTPPRPAAPPRPATPTTPAAPSTPPAPPAPPAPAPSTPAAPAPSPSLTKPRLEDETIRDLREAYAYSRELARDARIAEEWETVGETEARLADQFGLSRSAVHEIVLGIRYADAPGPVAHARRARYETYLLERDRLGNKAARARMRDVDLNSGHTSMVLEIRLESGAVTRQVLPAGAVVSLVPASLVQDVAQDQDG